MDVHWARAWAGVLGLLLIAPVAWAGEPSVSTSGGRSRARVYGTVRVEKDKDGKITSVAVLTVNQVTYKVALDENGTKLAEQFADKRASVLGYVTGSDRERSLTVLSFGEIKKEEKNAPKQPPTPRRSSSSGRTSKSKKKR